MCKFGILYARSVPPPPQSAIVQLFNPIIRGKQLEAIPGTENLDGIALHICELWCTSARLVGPFFPPSSSEMSKENDRQMCDQTGG